MFELRCSEFELRCSKLPGQAQGQRTEVFAPPGVTLLCPICEKNSRLFSVQLTAGSGFARTPSLTGGKMEGQTVGGYYALRGFCYSTTFSALG